MKAKKVIIYHIMYLRRLQREIRRKAGLSPKGGITNLDGIPLINWNNLDCKINALQWVLKD